MGCGLVKEKCSESIEDCQSNLLDHGYFMTGDISRCLRENTWHELLRFCEQTRDTWVLSRAESKLNTHYLASTTSFVLRVDSHLKMDAYFSFEPVPDVVKTLVSDIIDLYCPPDQYRVQVHFFDDLAGLRKLYQDQVEKSLVVRHRLGSLFWHQDKTANADNRYLFFAILNCKGCTRPQKNLLQIASAPSRSLQRQNDEKMLAYNVDLKDERKVKVLAKIRGDSGAGYMINEDFISQATGPTGGQARILVHSHDDLDFEYNGPHASVCRVKVIVRILRLDPKPN